MARRRSEEEAWWQMLLGLYFLPNINNASYRKEVAIMKGYYEEYSYVLILSNGKKIRFATEQEAKEYWEGS